MLWFRRDLRLADHPALLTAATADESTDVEVVPLFVVDPALWGPAGGPRRTWLARSLRQLDETLGGALVVRWGDPVSVVPDLVQAVAAESVHVSADAGPYGRRRDDAVAAALARLPGAGREDEPPGPEHEAQPPGAGREDEPPGAGVALVRTGTPYAIGPGTILNGSGQPYQVFTPFSRAWLRHGWPAPAATPGPARFLTADRATDLGRDFPDDTASGTDAVRLPAVGEAAARERWAEFCDTGLLSYGERRDLPAAPGTSGLSAHLKYGELHPRTLLADLARLENAGGLSDAALTSVQTFRSELCWREFYADVLWHHPRTAREYHRTAYAGMAYDEPGPDFDAWREGRTGYPFVDAGMRQLRAEGWLHNRVRMVVASFLVKDLHVEWQHGARHFMRWLRDGDLASNQHGWQWAAGSGTDAAPYFRIFNPVSQGERFDADGDYVRRYVPELGHLTGKRAHRPWDAPDGYDHGYPRRIVDHAAERAEALRRLREVTGKS